MSATKPATKPMSRSSRSAAKPTSKARAATRRKTQSPSNREPKSNGDSTGDSAAIVESKTQKPLAAQNSNGASGGAKTHAVAAPSNGTEAAILPPKTQRPGAAYRSLLFASETLEDIERVRIAAENRARALTHPEQNIGLAEDDPAVKLADSLASQLATVEKDATKAVRKAVRQTPLGPWVKATVGVGEKQAGRLLGVIGNPRIRVDGETGEIHERTVGQLWSYCGYSVEPAGGHLRHESHAAIAPGVAPRRKRGQQGNWNPKARMRTYLIAESCMKSPTSPYRRMYEDAREKYADATHKVACIQCGKKGKPAEAGTELRDGHKHARALRLVAKEVLKDLWLAAGQTPHG